MSSLRDGVRKRNIHILDAFLFSITHEKALQYFSVPKQERNTKPSRANKRKKRFLDAYKLLYSYLFSKSKTKAVPRDYNQTYGTRTVLHDEELKNTMFARMVEIYIDKIKFRGSPPTSAAYMVVPYFFRELAEHATIGMNDFTNYLGLTVDIMNGFKPNAGTVIKSKSTLRIVNNAIAVFIKEISKAVTYVDVENKKRLTRLNALSKAADELRVNEENAARQVKLERCEIGRASCRERV